MTAIPSRNPPSNIEPKSFVFNFGKYINLTFENVWQNDPSYIDWCAKSGAVVLPFINRNGKVIADRSWIKEKLAKAPVGSSEPYSDPDQMNSIKEDCLDDLLSKSDEPLANFDWIKF